MVHLPQIARKFAGEQAGSGESAGTMRVYGP